MHLSEPIEPATTSGGDYFQDLTDQVIGLAGEFVQSGGVRVLVKTNLGPALPIFVGEGGDGGLISALGLKAGVLVTDRNGNVLAQYGDPPPTEPLKLALLVALVGLVGLVIIRGVLPR